VRTLVMQDGEAREVSVEEVRERLGRSERFWLDVEGPETADYELLLEGFRFHPLTVEDVQLQNQRPKLDEFRDYKFAVLFTAVLEGEELRFREHHLYLSHEFLVSIHHQPSAPLEELRGRIADSRDMTRGEIGFVQYLVVNALVDSMFPTLDRLDETIDAMEDGVVLRTDRSTMSRISGLRHQVAELRRILGPQRDVFQRLLSHFLEHARDELTLYWRDVYENLIRQYEEVDSLRDLLSGTMDVYLSTVSNQQNNTMKQLTVITTVFLPLNFLTGFFGMNFAFLVAKTASPVAFWLGLALMLGAVALQLYLFRSRRWL
jgi:magnesium transporter